MVLSSQYISVCSSTKLIKLGLCHHFVSERPLGGQGYKKISKELRISISGVQTLIKKWKIRDSVETKPRSVRQISATTARKTVAKKISSADIQDSMKKVVWLFQDAQ